MCFISIWTTGILLGLAFLFVLPFPFTATSSAARSRWGTSCFPNCKWVTLLYTATLLENNVWNWIKVFVRLMPDLLPSCWGITIACACYSFYCLGLDSTPRFAPEIPFSCRWVLHNSHCCDIAIIAADDISSFFSRALGPKFWGFPSVIPNSVTISYFSVCTIHQVGQEM
jgi:hypothetical protein